MKRLLLLSLFASSSLFAKEPVKTTADLQPVAADMATAANALIASLDEAQVKKARFPFKSDERENWGFVPRKRNGLPLKELDDKQIEMAVGAGSAE